MAMRAAKRLAGVGALAGTSYLVYVFSQHSHVQVTEEERERQHAQCQKIPPREEQLKKLRAAQEFDLLVIGGGATGSGIALDATSRGLRVAMVERGDFASATSSKSTKLIHGGVRYLEKAFLTLDYEQFRMVKEALFERSMLLEIAPHLTSQIPIMIPIFKWWKVPYYFAGSKVYDLVAGSHGLQSSYFLSREGSTAKFPTIKRDNLIASMIYYDGQSNDARLNVSIVLTAAAYGATVANYVNVLSLIKEEENGVQVVKGAVVQDVLTKETWKVRAKGVINATGPFTDGIRKMDDQEVDPICSPSVGTHIVLSDQYTPSNIGLLDPATSDGRVVFVLPWEGSTIVGTTDIPTKPDINIAPTEEEIQYLMKELTKYLDPSVPLSREDVLSAWAGIRPLVRDPSKARTEALARNHIVHTSPSRLITVSGGKWTTYRSMASDTVDEAVKVLKLSPARPCWTQDLLLVGAHKYSHTLSLHLSREHKLESRIAKHLASSYGDKALDVLALSKSHKVLAPGYPYLESEVLYAVRHEFAQRAEDVLGRRTRLAFLNSRAALAAAPRVIELMASELNWSKARIQEEKEAVTAFLATMGLSPSEAAL